MYYHPAKRILLQPSKSSKKGCCHNPHILAICIYSTMYNIKVQQ